MERIIVTSTYVHPFLTLVLPPGQLLSLDVFATYRLELLRFDQF